MSLENTEEEEEEEEVEATRLWEEFFAQIDLAEELNKLVTQKDFPSLVFNPWIPRD